MSHYLKEIYCYREMIKNLVKKDLRTRYKGSILGFLWTFLNPLLQLIIYTIIFSTVMRIDVDQFYMFLFVGLVPWIFFSTSILIGTNTIISNKDLIKKIYFPREILPMSVVLSGFMNMIFSMIVVFLALLVSGIGITMNIIYLPIIMIVEAIFTLGVVLIVSSLNVYFRDIEHILGIVVMAWFYFTPIVYPIDMVPKEYLKYFGLNPMTSIISAYRDILYHGIKPDMNSLGVVSFLSAILLVIGYYIFKALQKNFAEEI